MVPANILRMLNEYDVGEGNTELFTKVYEVMNTGGFDEEFTDEEFISWAENSLSSNDTFDTPRTAWLSGLLNGFVNA